MAKNPKTQSKPSRHSSRSVAPQLPPEPVLSRPGGKLGLITDRVTARAGATIEELVEATGWQRHSVRGALSQLRSRGFGLIRDTTGERSAYRLDRSKA